MFWKASGSLRYPYGFIAVALFGALVAQYLSSVSTVSLMMGNFSSEMSETGIITESDIIATPAKRPSSFDDMVDTAYQHMLDRLPSAPRKNVFNISTWNDTTLGGLQNEDRVLLGRIYGEADSVMEYGLGESTYIANFVGVRRYVGIDSDPAWVAMARNKVSDHFRFYLADIGSTRAWGYPNKKLSKQLINYQLAPLMLELRPFDVYMVDGRFRFPCVLASFLHASARGGDPSKTKVLLHDCGRTQETTPLGKVKRHNYHAADHLLDLVDHSGVYLCVFMRKPNTTDEQLLDLWQEKKLDFHR